MALLPFRVGNYLWITICASSLTASLIVLLRAFRAPIPWWLVTVIVGASTLAYIVRDNLFHGQVDHGAAARSAATRCIMACESE